MKEDGELWRRHADQIKPFDSQDKLGTKYIIKKKPESAIPKD